VFVGKRQWNLSAEQDLSSKHDVYNGE